jgi:hypothetical protein
MEENVEFKKGIPNYKYLQMRTENLNFLVATEPCFSIPCPLFCGLMIALHKNYV